MAAIPSPCLAALSQIMLFVDGMLGVINHNETVQWLYTLSGSLVSSSVPSLWLSPGGFTPHLAFRMGLVPSYPQAHWVLLTEVTQCPQTDVTMLLGTEVEHKKGVPPQAPSQCP